MLICMCFFSGLIQNNGYKQDKLYLFFNTSQVKIYSIPTITLNIEGRFAPVFTTSIASDTSSQGISIRATYNYHESIYNTTRTTQQQ